jgi:hypothetical protein
MARPRVFVSSTYYDLKHIRASLENFIESLGFDAILSERGNIPYDPSLPPDESCYREVENADLFVLVIGGRYGSETSETKTDDPKTFYDRYESITKTEFAHAIEKDIPVYILIDRAVYAEYRTFLRNKTNTGINYVHADSVNVFLLIEGILAKRRNNPFQQFDRYSDIESWLREQWAGRFRDFLNSNSNQTQLASLAEQVRCLTEISTTLKTYIEQVVTTIAPERAKELIASEEKRLKEDSGLAKLQSLAEGSGNFPVSMLTRYKISPARIAQVFRVATTQEQLWAILDAETGKTVVGGWKAMVQPHLPLWQAGVTDIRTILGLPPLPLA